MSRLTNFIRKIKAKNSKGTIVLGDSLTEVFDYIYGDNPLYHPFWISGWQARGLGNVDKQTYIKNIMSNVNKESLVILCFGFADICFGYSYKKNKDGFVDADIFVDEIIAGIEATQQTLQEMGFKKVYNIFYSPIPQLPDSYWDSFNISKQVSTEGMAYILQLLTTRFEHKKNVINLIPNFSNREDSYICHTDFQRSYHDHHLDYIKIQEQIWNKIKKLPGVLPPIKKWQTELYPYIYFSVEELLQKNESRPRTCRN